MTSFIKNKNTFRSMSQMFRYTNKCTEGTQGVCKDSFTHGTSKYVHHLTSGCPTEVHKLCMEELVDYDNNDYVAVVMKPDKREPPPVFWRRVQVEINTQMDLYNKTEPHLTPNIPAIVIVNDNTPSIIMNESFNTLDKITPPNYAVLIMERIQIKKTDVAFDIDNFTTRLVDLGIFWWDFKPENTGYLLKDGDTNQVMIDCDNDFIYFFNDGDKKNKELKKNCKIFMMLEYSIFLGKDTQLPYTLTEILYAINYIYIFENYIIALKNKSKNDELTPINTLRFYMSFYINHYTKQNIYKPPEEPLRYLSRIIPLYFQLEKEGGYRKRRRTTRKRYRRRSKTKKAFVGSLHSRSS
jgi:hypothetical protein